jgi:regulator of sigma E protease
MLSVQPLLWLFSQAQNIFFVIIGLFGIGFLIGFHELGHFLFCKLFKISTPSFSIGFGPTIFTKKIGNTVFKLSAIPFGGYVEIAGSPEIGQGEQKEALNEDASSFAVKPFYQKFLVMIGGISFNLLFSYVTFVLLFMTGIPKTSIMHADNMRPVIANIQEGSAAAQYGLQEGDKIIAINNIVINNNIQQLLETVAPLADQQATVIVERDGNEQSIILTIGSKELLGKKIGSLGVSFTVIELPGLPFFQAIKQGIKTTNQWIYNTIYGFTHLFKKRDVSNMAGPVMILAMTIKSAAEGLKVFFIFLAIISVNLAVLNMIPLPILDGGQILFYAIEAIIRRPLSMRLREYIHLATWFAFLILFLYLTIQDISRIASPHIETLLRYIGWR